jgi:hypothetical protein
MMEISNKKVSCNCVEAFERSIAVDVVKKMKRELDATGRSAKKRR